MELARSGVAWPCRVENDHSWNAESQTNWAFEGLKYFCQLKTFENL